MDLCHWSRTGNVEHPFTGFPGIHVQLGGLNRRRITCNQERCGGTDQTNLVVAILEVNPEGIAWRGSAGNSPLGHECTCRVNVIKDPYDARANNFGESEREKRRRRRRKYDKDVFNWIIFIDNTIAKTLNLFKPSPSPHWICEQTNITMIYIHTMNDSVSAVFDEAVIRASSSSTP